MAGKVVDNRAMSSFDFEIVEDDSNFTSVDQNGPWINPAQIKLRHRIGRGTFGDIWLATHHHSTKDYDEYHEVAVKMLHPIKEDYINIVLNRLADLFPKCRGLHRVCSLRGISIINGRLCIVMKFYEDSVGDKMARVLNGKLSLNDVLRYGINLAQGIMDLHSNEILVLNLKPNNFLLNENDEAIIGDIGIPNILIGVPLLGSNMFRRLGSPNYMAPEQWDPEIRGPISMETDSWGFGCSIVEMLTGVQPWSGNSVSQIYDSVVKKLEKPRIPDNLPPVIENIIVGCFEYDLRNRPLMRDILETFKRSQDVVDLGCRMISERANKTGYSEWLLKKDNLQIGDVVRSRKQLNSCKPENMDVPEGIIVGLDQNGFVLVRVHGIHDPLRVNGSSIERVSFGLASGDWVRLKKQDKKHSPVGIIHWINRDGSVAVGFIGLESVWKGNCSELQMAKPYCVGQFVKLKVDVFSPRFEWVRKKGGEWGTGKVCNVLANGCLVVNFPGRLVFGEECGRSFLADPNEVELVSFENCASMVKKYQHLEDFHWMVRPIVIAISLFTAVKLGRRFVGKVKNGKKGVMRIDDRECVVDGQTGGGGGGGGAAWLPPKVANIIFREGGGGGGATVTTTSR